MKTFRVGNFLRGFFEVKGRTLKEGWTRGCRRFNRAYPAKKQGRMVYMEQLDETPVTITTAYVRKQLKLPKEQQYFSNMSEVIERGWITVAYGMSGEPLEIPKPQN